MDISTLNYLHDMMRVAAQGSDTKTAIENLTTTLRKGFVFDNVAIYLLDRETQTLDVTFARAVGRGKAAEADAAWGETFASQVLAKGTMIIQNPRDDITHDDRLRQAYLLGLPLMADGKLNGALIFVRFGGPAYEQEHIMLASLATEVASTLFERKAWKEASTHLEELRRQVQMQDDFVSTISHELRTPLGFIKGYSTSLLRQDTSWDPETQREFLTIIDEEADRLTELIENVLESARLQSRTLPLRFQPLRLDAVLRDVVQRTRSRYKDLQVDMDFQPVPPIQGDGVRLAQVFENLFTNAVKYAPGSPLNVLLRHVDQSMIVSLVDYGPGIPKESLPLIFERFYRVRGDRTVTGTGLGLYICKQIIEAHHGKIWAESTPGQGTTFFIELPLKPPK